MKVYGALQVAQLEWFTEAGKPAASSYPYRVIFNTDSNQVQVSDGTNWKSGILNFYTDATIPVADLSNIYTLAFTTDFLQLKVSNGTEWITVGARLDTYTSLTIPSASLNQYKTIWVSDIQQLQVSNGSFWIPVGVSSGLSNYFSTNNANANFENNSILPWSVCTLSSLTSTTPPIGAPTLSSTQMSLSVTTTTPLAGTYSAQLLKSAANSIGQGFISSPLTISREDLGKVLYVSFAYEVIANSSNFIASGTSTQSIEIWIYNEVSGEWTQPAGYRGINQSIGPGKISLSFQTDSNPSNNQYRIAIVTAQTSALSYTVNFDDFTFGPTVITNGAVITDWNTYTPTITGTTSNPTLGTNTLNAYWRRVGDSVEINFSLSQTGAGSAGSGDYLISLPLSLTADTSKISVSSSAISQGGSVIGNGWISNTNSVSTSSADMVFASMYNSTNIRLIPVVETPTLGPAWGSGRLPLSTATTNANFNAKVPIQGWSSNVQMSNDTDTRVVAAIYGSTSTASLTANVTPITYGTLIKDTHGMWNGTTGTAQVTGFYRISASNYSTTSHMLKVFKGGVSYQSGTYGTVSNTSTVTTLMFLNSGETFDIRSDTNITVNNSSTSAVIGIERISGPSVIAASEKIAASYWISANTAIGTAVVNFNNKEFDTHGAVTVGASWKFTSPRSGFYQVSVFGYFVSGSNTDLTIFKNGTYTKTVAYCTNGAGVSAEGTSTLFLNAGDYIDVRSSTGGTLRGSNTAVPADSGRVDIISL